MTRLFVSHLNGQHQIPLADVLSSLPWIVGVLILVSLLSRRVKRPLSGVKRDRGGDDTFGIETATTLKGIAVLLLIFGHLAIKCVEGVTFFEYAGSWAVVIFIFLSGNGLVMKYGLKKQARGFLKKRAQKLVWPFWLTLLLFYTLDYLLLARTYTWWDTTLTFFGIVLGGPPNAPAWFMTFILFLYAACALACYFPVSDGLKPLIVLIMLLAGLCLGSLTRLGSLFGGWVQYFAVFPTALLIAYHSRYVFKVVRHLHDFSRPLFLGTIAALFLLYHRSSGISILSRVLPVDEAAVVMEILRSLYLIAALVLTGYLIELSRFTSRFLTILGLYSYEIFLLHLPFMESYDFILFRKPLVLFFFIYLSVIVSLAFALHRLADLLRTGAWKLQGPGTGISAIGRRQARCA